MADKRKGAFLGRLVEECPSLPFLALGVWQAWVYISYYSSSWLSDTEVNGMYVSIMYIISTISCGCIFLLSTFIAPRARAFLERPCAPVLGGVIGMVGCLLIILAGPYYLGAVMSYAFPHAIFLIGCSLSGIGTATVGLKCGELYGSLPPRRAILYAAFSQVLLVCVFFMEVGSPTWAPIAGGPSLAGIVAFMGLPVLAGFLASLSRYIPDYGRECVYKERRSSFPKSLWKLMVVAFVFSVVGSMLHAQLVEISPLDVTLDSTRMVMLIRLVLALVFLLSAVSLGTARFSFGKLFSIIMVASAVLIAFCPILGVTQIIWSQVNSLLLFVFEFALWCVLSFVVYQKGLSSILVFGFGYGAFALGSGLGWMLGVRLLPSILSMGSNGLFFYILMMALVLFCALFLFSEKEYDSLFMPTEPDEKPLEELFCDETDEIHVSEVNLEKKGKFNQALDELADEHQLSAREKDVFKCLAMGYNAEATANRLMISWNTARTHIRNIYAKFDVHSHQELIALIDEVLGK